MGHRATTICLIIANRANGDASADYKPHMKKLIEYTLILSYVNHLLIMIQRIQTIYLLVVAIIMTIPLYVPIAQLLIPSDASYNFFTYGVVLIGENSVLQAHYWALLIMNIFTIGIPLVNVFLFKKRFLQLRLCIVEIILLIGAIILMWYHINQFANKMNAEILYKFSLILPVICIIFTYLAIKGILKISNCSNLLTDSIIIKIIINQ